MDSLNLIGMRVLNKNSHAIGVITSIENGKIEVNYHDSISKHLYPAAFADFLELEEEKFQQEIQHHATNAAFDVFKHNFNRAIQYEIAYLKQNGGKKYRIIDGIKISEQNGFYVYGFDTDTELHFPDGTAIKLLFPDQKKVTAYVVSCEDFTILIRTSVFLGDTIKFVDFTSEQWQLLEAQIDRLSEMNPRLDSIAYEIACNVRRQIEHMKRIQCGQNAAFHHATTEKISFIWGPPGTGKTETLANIALEHISRNRRVLMLSYSNISVDGALLRVARKADLPEGTVIRYGYPRAKELLDDNIYTSYQYILRKYPDLSDEYQSLISLKKRLKKKEKRSSKN